MWEFLKLKEESFGLDINDLSLKIIKITQKNKMHNLVTFGYSKIDPDIINGGAIQDENALAEEIKKAYINVKGKKLKTKYVVSSLPEEKSFLQVVKMPIMKENELQSAVYLQAENYIPLPMNDVYLEFSVINKDNKNKNYFEVLMIAMPKKVVNSYVRAIKKADLTPIMMVVESQAIAKAVIKNKPLNSSVAIIDLGKDNANFIVFSGESVHLTSSLNFSSNRITKEISKSLGLGMSQAEKIKRNFVKNKKILNTTTPMIEDLASQIKKYINFYEEHSSSSYFPGSGKIEKVILCGGGSILKGLPEFLNKQLGITIEVGNPLANLHLNNNKNVKLENWLPFTSAIGLSLMDL